MEKNEKNDKPTIYSLFKAREKMSSQEGKLKFMNKLQKAFVFCASELIYTLCA